MIQANEQEKTMGEYEGIFAVAYYIIYMGYLVLQPETEWMHWLTLVGLPLLFLFLYHRFRKKLPFKFTLASFGIQKHNLKNGVGWAILLGLALSVLQLFLSGGVEPLLDLIQSGKIFLFLPLAFLLLLLTAGFTEEFFFRGFLLTRLDQWTGSKWWAIVISAVFFGLYHFPYAYLNPDWPSYGNLPDALITSLTEGVPAGLILGFVYVKSKNNLIASVLVHSMIDLLPAMTMLKFMGQ